MSTIKLPSLAGPLPLWIVVHHADCESEWIVQDIEIFADPDCRILLADGISFHELPVTSQLALFEALHQHQRIESARRRVIRQGLVQLEADGGFI